jgi:hypothetical protein
MTTTMPDHAITGRIYNIEPCPYCRDDATVKEVSINDICSLLVVGNSLLAVSAEHAGAFADIRINYCPICGRKLEGEG